MNISKFFIERPVFSAVLSGFILIAGLISLFKLPISEYPEVVPPSIVVRASYPGANPQVISETVAAPLEQEIVGVEDMLYMSSQATLDGNLSLTITFKIGTDIDRAQVQVQNRVSSALPRLPEEVRQLGVSTTKTSPDLMMAVNLVSKDHRYDALYLRNYAVLNVKDELARLPGMGSVQVFGAGDYAMRVWLDPEKLAVRNLTTGDVASAIREQNLQVAAGQIGAPPAPGSEFQIALDTMGRLSSEEDFRNIVIKTGANGEVLRLGEGGTCRDGRQHLRAARPGRQRRDRHHSDLPGAGFERAGAGRPGARHDGAPQAPVPRHGFPDHLRPHGVRAAVHRQRDRDAAGSRGTGGAGGDPVPADLARFHHPAGRRAGVGDRQLRGTAPAGFSINTLSLFGLVLAIGHRGG